MMLKLTDSATEFPWKMGVLTLTSCVNSPEMTLYRNNRKMILWLPPVTAGTWLIFNPALNYGNRVIASPKNKPMAQL